jgi:hypothetical protein
MQDQVILKAVNSLVDYSNRSTDQMFDDVTMSKIRNLEKYPVGVAYTCQELGLIMLVIRLSLKDPGEAGYLNDKKSKN